MHQKSSVIQKLSQYGVEASKLSQRQLQQKIIKMYDLLQKTMTQNLLLRKQNDDLSLQIKTIDEVFIDTNNNSLASSLSPRTYRKVCRQIIQDNDQYKTNILQPYPYSSNSKKTISDSSQNQTTHKKKFNYNQNLEKCDNRQHKSVYNQQKTPRYASKPHRNSRFCSYQKVLDKQQTSRIISANRVDSQQQNSLNEKLQILMKQNEIIMKRMNQIEENFIRKPQNQQENIKRHKNLDERLTKLSSNITSIQSIWAKKDYEINSTGLSSNNRTHYSTNNLRSYCPGVYCEKPQRSGPRKI